MSTLLRKVPVVTYTLLERVEAQTRQRKIAESYRAAAKEYEAALLKTKLENEKRLAEKRAVREEIKRTHVIPTFFLEEKRAKKVEEKKLREFAMVEHHRQKKLAEDLLREQKEWTERLKQFKKEVSSSKIVPLVAKRLPSVFQESDIGKDTYIECETPLVPILSTLAKIVGFDVDTCECGDSSVLFFRKPYPYWRYAFSGGKRSVH